MPYGSIKVDNFIHSDGSNPDVTVAISSLATKASTTGAVFTGNIDLDNQQQLRLRETDAEGDNFVALRAPSALAADLTLTFPDALPAAQTTGVLQSDPNGDLTWANLTDTSARWTKGQRGEVTTVASSGGVLDINFDASNNFYVVLNENITSITYNALDTDMIGQTGSIFFQQPNSGHHTVGGWANTSRWAGGTGGANNQPTFTATANTTDRVDYVITSTGNGTANNNVVVQLVHTANYAE